MKYSQKERIVAIIWLGICIIFLVLAWTSEDPSWLVNPLMKK